MTRAYCRRQRRAMAQKVAALLVVSVAPVAVTDPVPLVLQPIMSPTAFLATAVQTRPPSNVPSQPQPSAAPEVAGPEGAAPTTVAEIESPSNAPSQRQPLDATEATGPGTAIDINDLRRELLDYRAEALNSWAKTVDWWLTVIAGFLTLLGIVAVVAGYVSFKFFREIESEAREHAKEIRDIVDQTKASRDEAASAAKEAKEARKITAEDVHNDPGKAEKAAANDPTASPIDQAVAKAVRLQQNEDIEEAIKKWHALAVVSEGSNKELAARSWFSVGYLLHQKHDIDVLETAIRCL